MMHRRQGIRDSCVLSTQQQQRQRQVDEDNQKSLIPCRSMSILKSRHLSTTTTSRRTSALKIATNNNNSSSNIDSRYERISRSNRNSSNSNNNNTSNNNSNSSSSRRNVVIRPGTSSNQQQQQHQHQRHQHNHQYCHQLAWPYTSSCSLLSVLAWSMTLLLVTSCIGYADAGALMGHPFSKRSFMDIQCKGVYDKSLFARLDRICEDCYNLFREPQLHTLCRKNCFTSDYFKGCLDVLLLQDEMEWIQTSIKQLHGADPGV